MSSAAVKAPSAPPSAPAASETSTTKSEASSTTAAPRTTTSPPPTSSKSSPTSTVKGTTSSLESSPSSAPSSRSSTSAAPSSASVASTTSAPSSAPTTAAPSSSVPSPSSASQSQSSPSSAVVPGNKSVALPAGSAAGSTSTVVVIQTPGATLSSSGAQGTPTLSVYQTTDAQGRTHTITTSFGGPSSTSKAKSNSFLANTGAVAGVSVVAGIIGAALITFLILTCIRRRRMRQREQDARDFSQMSYVRRSQLSPASGGAGAGGGVAAAVATYDLESGAHNNGEYNGAIGGARSDLSHTTHGTLRQSPLSAHAPTNANQYPSRATGNILDDEFADSQDVAYRANGMYAPVDDASPGMAGRGVRGLNPAADLGYPPLSPSTQGDHSSSSHANYGRGQQSYLGGDPFADSGGNGAAGGHLNRSASGKTLASKHLSQGGQSVLSAGSIYSDQNNGDDVDDFYGGYTIPQDANPNPRTAYATRGPIDSSRTGNSLRDDQDYSRRFVR